MTGNKRFNFVGGYLYDGDKPVGHINDIRFREDFLDLLNNLDSENQTLKSDRARYEEECRLDIFKELSEKNEQLKEHQRTLEAKIVRLKDRVKTFEKHYSLKDIERYKKMDNCNCIHSRRLKND